MALDVMINVRASADNLHKKLGQVKGSMTSLNRQVKVSDKGWSKYNKKLKKTDKLYNNITKDGNRASASMKGLNNSFGGLKKLVGAGIGYQVGRQMTYVIQSTVDMIETVNLFNVSMGKSALVANEFVTSMHDVLGLDMTNLQNSVGTYGLLARSMGMTNKNATTLATNTAKLATDLSSLTNVPINQVMHDLRSGLVGQSETVYKYGIDITEASLKQEAYIQGVTKSVRAMSQGEKMGLRYSAMVRQTVLAHGDFARTINTPANQLRIFTERVVTAGRAIGSIFLPALASILPYAIAVIIVVTEMANTLAAFFGYKAPQVQDLGLGSIGSGADDVAKALDGATDSAKKLQKTTSGMDELNVISSPSDSGGGSGGGLGATGGLTPDLSGYDNMLSTVEDVSQEIADKMAPALKTALGIAIPLGATFLGFKIKNLLSGLGKATGLIKKTKAVAKMGFFARLFSDVKGIQLLSTEMGFVKTVTGLFGKVLGKVFGVGGIISGAIGMVTSMTDILKGNTIELSDQISYLWGLLALSVGAAVVFTPIAGAFVLLAGSIGLLTASLSKTDFFNPLREIELFGEGVSDATKEKLEPFMKTVDELDGTLDSLEFTKELITKETADSIIGNATKIKEGILEELDVDRNADLKQLESIKGTMNDEAYAELLSKTNTYYDNQIATVTENTDRINEITKKHLKDGTKLTVAEYDELTRLRDANEKIAMDSMTESLAELQIIKNNMHKNELSENVKKVSKILVQSAKQRDKTIEDAEITYEQSKLNINKMYQLGTIDENQRDAMILVAQNQRDETVSAATDTYLGIYNSAVREMPKIKGYLEKATGEQLTTLDRFFKNVGAGYDGLIKKAKEWAGYGDIEPKTQGSATGNAGYSSHSRTGYNTTLDVSASGGSVPSGTAVGTKVQTQGGTYEVVSPNSYMANENKETGVWSKKLYADGGFPSMGEMFVANESGAEMIGNVNGRSAVVNNDQIVQAVSQGVAKAVSSVMGNQAQQPVVLNLDGEVIYSNQQKIKSNRGSDFGMGVFAK